MNSMEEDSLFAEHGWTKDLIGRRWVSPKGIVLRFDDVVGLTDTPEGEEALREAVEVYGEPRP